MRLLALLAGLALAAPALAQSEARYRVTFESTWSAQTHPAGYPGPSAHYSSLIGATHATAGAVWRPGDLATPGVEQMAETGGTALLTTEIDALQVSGEAGERVTGGGLGTTPGSVHTEFVVTTAHPRLTLVTMVAPSPDWFVGVDGLDLREGAGWVAAREVELHVWDAGTDSGSGYTSPNQDTQPREPIALSDAAPFAGGNTRLGTFRFELLSVVDADDGAAEAAFTVGTVTPTPSAGAARLSVTSAVAAEARLDIVDVMGRTVATQTHTLNAGERTLDLPTAGLAPGSYAVRVRVGDEVSTRRLVVAR